MATVYKYNEVPYFSRREGDSLLFNLDGYLEYYVPEDYFEGKSGIMEGSYVKLLGSFNYRIFDENDKPGNLMTFNYPTMFMCRPGETKKKVKLKLDDHLDEAEYRVLIFRKDDQLITRIHTEQEMDNMSELFRLHLKTGKVPNTIPYDQLYLFPYECMGLNGGKYSVHSQAMGLLYSKICRDPDDINKPFRMSKAIDNSMTGYRPISIKLAAKMISPFVSLTSENMDQAIVSAVLLTEDENTGKSKHKESPLERVMTM